MLSVFFGPMTAKNLGVQGQTDTEGEMVSPEYSIETLQRGSRARARKHIAAGDICAEIIVSIHHCISRPSRPTWFTSEYVRSTSADPSRLSWLGQCGPNLAYIGILPVYVGRPSFAYLCLPLFRC